MSQWHAVATRNHPWIGRFSHTGPLAPSDRSQPASTGRSPSGHHTRRPARIPSDQHGTRTPEHVHHQKAFSTELGRDVQLLRVSPPQGEQWSRDRSGQTCTTRRDGRRRAGSPTPSPMSVSRSRSRPFTSDQRPKPQSAADIPPPAGAVSVRHIYPSRKQHVRGPLSAYDTGTAFGRPCRRPCEGLRPRRRLVRGSSSGRSG